VEGAMQAATDGVTTPPEETNRLLTSAEYLASLDDGRAVYLDGERVKDVANHPAFRNSARSVARLYDSLHDPAQRELLTAVDERGIRTHRFYQPSYTPQDLLASREAIAAWARLSYGFMGRTPDYKAAFMASLAADPAFYAPYDNNAIAWYEKFAGRGLFLNHVLVNPPIDRKKPVHEVADVFVHVVRERDDGIIVSGAKMLATGSAITHATFVAQNSSANLEKGRAEDFALVFIAPLDTPGSKLLCRNSYESAARSPFDNPLSSRFDENDAVLIFDEAFIPWENVLVYRDVERANSFYRNSGFFSRYNLQAATRLGVKLDFMIGLFAKGIAANGTDEFRGVQVALGEIIGWRNLVWALTTAMCLDPQPGPGRSVVPKQEHAAAYRLFAHECWQAIHSLFETYLGGSPLVVPSSYKDLQNPELRPLIDRFYRGSDGDAESRVKLFKLIWDAIGSEFGARHELYERNYSGNNEQIRLDLLGIARGKRHLADSIAFADACMADYNLDGWTSDTWVFDGGDDSPQRLRDAE
jgi:4-hydroxyphenylacetate 3-monooxygenase